jgi:proteasome regulatory subunit
MGSKEDFDHTVFSYTTSSTSELEEENRLLRETLSQLREEVQRFRTPALMVAEVVSLTNDNGAIINLPNGNKFMVKKSKDSEDLLPGESVLVEQRNLTIIDKVHCPSNFNVDKFVIIEKPKIQWKDIGGLNDQVREIKEVVELPLLKPELFEKVGINPPKGVLLHGPPGTGKTLLAKAVANSTESTFIEVVGSELVQKFIGEGAKLVKEVFKLAREKAPSIVFIDEIDSLASKRVELGTSGEREVQRTFMQLLSELDGFKSLDNVKVIGCTNRMDILDPAIIRPGRLDRLLEVPNPDIEGIKEILKIHTSKMKLSMCVNLDKLTKKLEGFSGAEVKAVCTEAGYFAIRDNRHKVVNTDFLQAIDKIRSKEDSPHEYRHMYG